MPPRKPNDPVNPNPVCPACSSSNLAEFNAEICLRGPGPEGLNNVCTFAFPTVAVCLDCGLAQGKLSADDLQRIRQSRQPPGIAP